MPVHPKLQEIIDRTKAANLPAQKEQTLEQVRNAFTGLRLLAGEPEGVYKIENKSISTSEGSILLRLFYPKKKEKFPMLLYFHPGGFVKGDIETYDPICRMVANRSNCLVISVGYRLAPENRFPSQIEDGIYALKWIYENAKEIGGDEKKIAIGGESSGGTLAAALTHLNIHRKGPHISFQVLIYPLLDFSFSYPSHKEFNKGFLLDEASLNWYKEMYLSHEDNPKSPLVSPLWQTHFSDLPPTVVITAEYDPLRDEGEAYVEKLQSAGVAVHFTRYEGMTHGFFMMPGILDDAKRAIAEVGEELNKALIPK